MNKCIIAGRLVVEPEMRKTKSDIGVTSNTLAVNRKYRDADGNTTCDYINIAVWGPSAEYLCKYGHKGDMVMVSGAIRQQKYVDKDGNNRSTYEVNVEELEIYSKRDSKPREYKDEYYPDGDMSFENV